MMTVDSGDTSFKCPVCNAGLLEVILRGATPVYYHCQNSDCRARMRASWTLCDDAQHLVEQCVHDGKTYDLGKNKVEGR